MVDNRKTNADGDQLLISVKFPYKNLTSVNGYTDSITGETDSLHYDKQFRWSTDGILYNDWKELTNENLKNTILDYTKDFWPQYKFTQNGNGELEFESITLQTTSNSGLLTEIPMCGVLDNGSCCGQQNLVFDCCNEGFNPYNLGNSSFVYTQLSRVVSNMFGFCVRYFKTSANQQSKDVILHEYSLLNVINEGDVKLIIPDNQLPTREINFNPMMMDYPVVFEVHIVKSAFREIFGQDSKPEVGDYLYFEQYMNKMYEINATSETDDYLYTGAYWRVSLAQYQKRSAVKFDSSEDEVETNTLIFNSDKFNIETIEQETDVRKPKQYETIGQSENDYVRRILDKRLHIQNENIYNNWTVIAKSHYALGSVKKSNPSIPVVSYRYDKGWSSTDERMLTFWMRNKLNASKTEKTNIAIEELKNINNKLVISIPRDASLYNDSSYYDKLDGCIVKLSGTNYPKVIKIKNIEYYDESNIYLYTNLTFINGCASEPKIIPLETNTCIMSEGGFSFSYTVNYVCITINNKDYIFNLSDLKSDDNKRYGFEDNKWYGIIIMFKPADNKIGLWVYGLSDGNNKLKYMDSELVLKYNTVKDNCMDIICSSGNWALFPCNMDITNIRLWNQLCEETLHNLILSQYVIKDSHLCEIVDNAQPELLIPKVTNAR